MKHEENCIPAIEGNYFVFKVARVKIEDILKKHGKVHFSVDKPKVEKTLQQLRAAHSLITAYFLSGLHSAPDWVVSPDLMKLYIKLEIGVCIDFEKDGQFIKIPVSFSDYTKDQQSDFITGLISMIDQSDASGDKKIAEILQGMKDNSLF